MHTVVIRRDLLTQRPDLAHALYHGFTEAKEVARKGYEQARMEQNGNLMIPWLTPLLEENLSLLSDDWWPYGLDANREAIDTYLRYFFEQGLSRRRLTCEDIFVPELLGT